MNFPCPALDLQLMDDHYCGFVGKPSLKFTGNQTFLSVRHPDRESFQIQGVGNGCRKTVAATAVGANNDDNNMGLGGGKRIHHSVFDSLQLISHG